MRLVQFVALCGISSRRKAVAIIKNGEIQVNTTQCLDPAYIVQETDVIYYQSKQLSIPESYVYLALNKPKNVISASSSPHGEITVIDLVKNKFPTQRLYPIGRLDKDSTGLIILTNDGHFAQKIAHPAFEITKKYRVKITKKLSKTDHKLLISGVTLEDGFSQFDELQQIAPKTYEVSLHSGKNRIIRRMFAYLGHEVIELHRISIGSLSLKNLALGNFKHLSPEEISNLTN
ncbi:rRNA pseudouridine synthase [Candidatus Dependentiae bacterium]|nr:rRNA pseudouridine synthase [Candidatus Dependentiae bacterium]